MRVARGWAPVVVWVLLMSCGWAEEQNKGEDKNGQYGALCPTNLNMMFGGWFYYTAVPEEDCPGGPPYTICVQQPMLVGCANGQCHERYTGQYVRGSSLADAKSRRTDRVLGDPVQNAPIDQRSTAYLTRDTIRKAEAIATYGGNTFRLVLITWEANGTHRVLVAHRCPRREATVELMDDAAMQGQVKVRATVGEFPADEVVDFLIMPE